MQAIEILSRNTWRGESVYVVGGGPSLRDFDWTKLKGKNVIVCNVNPHFVSSIRLFQDERLIKHLQRNGEVPHDSTKDLIITLSGKINIPGCFGVRHSKEAWSANLEHGLPMRSNVGYAAVNLAILLGAQDVRLLGFDMDSPGKYIENHHDEYPRSFKVPVDNLTKYIEEFDNVPKEKRSAIVVARPTKLTQFVTIPMEEMF